jgi:hypothetical protein
MSANNNFISQEGKREVKVAKLNSKLELLEAQLSTNN